MSQFDKLEKLYEQFRKKYPELSPDVAMNAAICTTNQNNDQKSGFVKRDVRNHKDDTKERKRTIPKVIPPPPLDLKQTSVVLGEQSMNKTFYSLGYSPVGLYRRSPCDYCEREDCYEECRQYPY